MKILFLLALLANIIFFLWESNSENANDYGNEIDLDAPKQILLQSELDKGKETISIAKAENKAVENSQTLPVKPSIKELVEAKSKKTEKGVKIEKVPEIVAVLNDKKDSVINKPSPEKQAVDKDEKNDIKKNEGDIQTIAGSDVVAVLNTKKERVLEKENRDNPKKDDIKKVMMQSNNQPTKSAVRCYQVGPFKSTDAFTVWRQLNKIDPASLSLFNKERDVYKQYMVYFPAADSIAEANENADKIKASGITDLWLFTEGEYKDGISLGLYDREAPAMLFIEKLAKMDLKAEIKSVNKKELVVYSRISTMKKDFKETVSLSDGQEVIDCEKNYKE